MISTESGRRSAVVLLALVLPVAGQAQRDGAMVVPTPVVNPVHVAVHTPVHVSIRVPHNQSANAPTSDSAAVIAVIEAARGANALLCELTARSVESQWGWGGGETDPRAPRDPQLRAALDLARGRRTHPGTVQQLAAALADSDACVRRLAAPLLGRAGPVAYGPLRSALQSDQPPTREAAALGLGFTNDAAVIPALLACLNDQATRVRVACVWALGEIEDERAIGALVRVLREDREAEVRAAAAWAIGSIEG